MCPTKGRTLNISDQARLWAAISLNDRGDLLMSLSEAYELARYSAYPEDVERDLRKLITLETDWMREEATGPNAKKLGYDPEVVAEAIEEIDSDRNSGT